jgi:hypothetical protein
VKTLKVKSYTKQLPFKNEPEIKKALSDNLISWYEPYSIFDIEDDKMYLSSMYSNSIKIYDNKFNLLETIALKKIPTPNRPFKMPFEERQISDVNERMKREQRLQFENASIYNIDVHKNLVLIQLNKPLESGRHIFKDLNSLQNGDIIEYDNVIIMLDTNTKRESLFTLPKRFKGKANFLNENQILVTGTSGTESEDNYLYTIKF